MGYSLPTPALEGRGWIGRLEVLGLNYGVITLPFFSRATKSSCMTSLNPISSLAQWRFYRLPPACREEMSQEHITSSEKQKWSSGMLADPGFFPIKPF